MELEKNVTYYQECNKNISKSRPNSLKAKIEDSLIYCKQNGGNYQEYMN